MEKAIGVIGGVGPYAGLDLVKKIFDHTVANRDQDHLDLYLTNLPERIEDRTTFLLEGGDNPAEGIFQSLEKLVHIGATTIAIPCNTAHAAAIYTVVSERTAQVYPHVTLLNMIDETCRKIAHDFPQGGKIGLLATKGTHAVGVYRQYLDAYPSLQLIEPDLEGRERVHSAIYDPSYGIKAVAPVSAKAIGILEEECRKLVDQEVSAIILGCTELPLALHAGMFSCTLVDPTLVLARAAISSVAPHKLRQC
jgi:aspartate racemase